MPLYDYECPRCGTRQEIICRVDDRPETTPCTTSMCRGQARQVIIGAPAVFGEDLTPDQRKYAEFCLTNRRAVRMKKEKPIECRSDFNRVMSERQITLDRSIRTED